MTQAFPLQWPKGRPRTKSRDKSPFKVKPSQAFDELMKELQLWGVSGIVVSSNIPLRRDGTPYRDGLTDPIEDPGIAVYFTRRKKPAVIVCDTYRLPWENVRALGLSINAMRSIDRHGAHQVLDQMFEGFTALPSPDMAGDAGDKAWWVVLGVSPDATEQEIEDAYKAAARVAGGASVELNAAKEAGLRAAG